MFDLIIHNGRVVDYKNHLDQVTDIAVKDGRIASIGTALGKAKSHLDAKNLLVIPGIVDSHMHASSWLGGPDSLKMLALAGVTTAIEMAGPVDSVKKFIKENGTGLNIGCLEQLRPGVNLSSNHPSSQEILRAVQIALKKGAGIRGYVIFSLLRKRNLFGGPRRLHEARIEYPRNGRNNQNSKREEFPSRTHKRLLPWCCTFCGRRDSQSRTIARRTS